MGISEGFQGAANAAKDKLVKVLASGIVATDELTEEEAHWLKELEEDKSLTQEQRKQIVREIGEEYNQ
jgi:hypothetical protein